MRIPLGALQHPIKAAGPHPGQTSDSQVSAVASPTGAEGIVPAVPSPSPTLMERLNPVQRSAFLRVWARLPPHLREIAFDLHDPGWDPPTIEQLGDVLCDFSDVFSTSKTDFGSCSLMPFEISVPEGSAPVTSRPHRINPILAREVDATLNQYLAAGLIQHSTSPYSSPLVVIPKKSGGVRITVNYKKLNQISKLSQLPIPRVDQVLDSLGSGRVFSLFDLVSSFHQITAHKDTVPLTAFCTPTGLYEWLVMPQGSSASPGWFVKVINEVIKGLTQVAAYLDDVIVFDSDPVTHVRTIRSLFERLRKHNLKLSPSKARLGATDANFLGHSISPAGLRPNSEKVSALTNMPMPTDVKQVRALMGGINYYRKFLPDLSKRLRPINALLRKGVKFVFTPDMEKLVREILAELTTPPVLVFPDWDAVADGTRPFHVYCDACIDGFGAALEQEQTDGSIKPIAYISRATLDSERHWTPLDLEAGSIVWALKRLRGYLWGTKFRIFSDHKALENIGKVGNHNGRVQRWLEFLTAFDYTLEYRKGSANGNADFLSRLPEPATEHDRNGSTSLTPVEDGGIYLIRACGLYTPSSPIPGVGLGGLMPRTESNALGGLPLTLADFCDFRTHGPRMRLDDLPTPSRRFVARVSASTATVDSSPGRGGGSRTADYNFASVFAVPIVTNEDSAEAPAATTSVAQSTPSRSSIQGTNPVEPMGPTASVPTSPGSPAPQTMTPFSDRISTRTRRRSATAAGEEPPAVNYGFGPGGAPRPSSRRVTTPPRVPRPRPAPPAAATLLLPTRRFARCHFRPTATTQSLWELLPYGTCSSW